ncbi:hypothetical protein Poly59_51410 [Rubripirellula reticaptiva]|uniref:Uncharacterized protein n=1 Tax=Rubripirellula reticaptiva TaxID=2528013 RepID=A0A5C6EIL5_9BACT|nr:hypothetical protein Poly59_51410 [Rubripirellula reticaptiva]
MQVIDCIRVTLGRSGLPFWGIGNCMNSANVTFWTSLANRLREFALREVDAVSLRPRADIRRW